MKNFNFVKFCLTFPCKYASLANSRFINDLCSWSLLFIIRDDLQEHYRGYSNKYILYNKYIIYVYIQQQLAGKDAMHFKEKRGCLWFFSVLWV